jgi:phosphatidate cytidylyltransferase
VSEGSPARDGNNVRLRIISSIVLMAIALGCLFLGARALQILTGVLGVLMCFEWSRRTIDRPDGGRAVSILAAIAMLYASILAAYHANWAACLLALLIGLSFVLASTLYPGFKGRRLELLLGILYIVCAGVALVALRGAEPGGTAIVLWLFVLVWAGDTAAYLIGRRFGRHTVLAGVSAAKTWEGFIGGAAASVLVGLIAAPPLPWSLSQRLLACAGLAIVAQLGDLLESAIKRRFGVKDMSGLIPGHGGVLDRLDSLLPVLIVSGAALSLMRWLGLP